MIASAETREAIQVAVKKACEHRCDGPGFTWRGFLLANILNGLAAAEVFYPVQETMLRELAKKIARDADDNLDDEWPK